MEMSETSHQSNMSTFHSTNINTRTSFVVEPNFLRQRTKEEGDLSIPFVVIASFLEVVIRHGNVYYTKEIDFSRRPESRAIVDLVRSEPFNLYFEANQEDKRLGFSPTCSATLREELIEE